MERNFKATLSNYNKFKSLFILELCNMIPDMNRLIMPQFENSKLLCSLRNFTVDCQRCNAHDPTAAGLCIKEDAAIILYIKPVFDKCNTDWKDLPEEVIRNGVRQAILMTYIHETFHLHQDMSVLNASVEGMSVKNNSVLFTYFVEDPVYYMTYKFVLDNVDAIEQLTGVQININWLVNKLHYITLSDKNTVYIEDVV